MYIADANLQLIFNGMKYKSVKGFSGFGQFGILLLFIGLGLILTSIAQLIIFSYIIPSGLTSTDLEKNVMSALLKPENVFYARLAQVSGTFFLMFIPAVLYSWVVNGKNPLWLGFSKYVNAKQIALGFLFMFLASMLASPLSDLSKSIVAHFPDLNQLARSMEDTYNEQVVALSNLQSWPEYLMALVIMAFFPALFEELFFRGAIQNLLINWWRKPFIAIFATALIFSLIHMSVYLFLSRLILGFALGMMYYITKNIWVTVIAHFINNAIAVTQLFWVSQTKKAIAVDSLDPEVPWWLAVITLIAIYFVYTLLKKISEKNRSRIIVKEQTLYAIGNIHDPFQKI